MPELSGGKPTNTQSSQISPLKSQFMLKSHFGRSEAKSFFRFVLVNYVLNIEVKCIYSISDASTLLAYLLDEWWERV